MSSIKSANHPSNWRKSQNPTNNDVIKDILTGNKETKRLNEVHSRKDHTPETMIGKLSMFAKNTTNDQDKNQAKKAIKLLEPLSPVSPLGEAERIKIFNQL